MSIAGYRDTAQFLLLLAKDMELTNTHFAGILIAGFFIFLAKRRWSRMGDESAQKRLYRSDHGVLNVQLPPQSMWMNMGFWKVYSSHRVPVPDADLYRIRTISHKLAALFSKKYSDRRVF